MGTLSLDAHRLAAPTATPGFGTSINTAIVCLVVISPRPQLWTHILVHVVNVVTPATQIYHHLQPHLQDMQPHPLRNPLNITRPLYTIRLARSMGRVSQSTAHILRLHTLHRHLLQLLHCPADLNLGMDMFTACNPTKAFRVAKARM